MPRRRHPGRLWPQDDDERQRAIDAGHDLDAVLSTDDLVTSENCFFVATGITDGELLRGVRYRAGGVITHSLVMRSKSGTIRLIESHHQLAQAAGLQRHRLRPRPHHGYAVSERILVIGEALIDRVRDTDGDVVEHPGGSPANVAVGLARLDHLVDFATRIGQDERGARIANHLTRHGVSLLEVSVGPNPTSVAEAPRPQRGCRVHLRPALGPAA